LKTFSQVDLTLFISLDHGRNDSVFGESLIYVFYPSSRYLARVVSFFLDHSLTSQDLNTHIR
jgi:hypothetical protein